MPTGPVTITLSITIWTIVIGFLLTGQLRHKQIAIVFALSWISARFVTANNDVAVLIFGYTICALICIYSKDVIVRLIGMIYGLRIVVLPTMTIFDANTETYWLWVWETNTVLLVIQILLALGTLDDGRTRVVMADSRLVRWAANSVSVVHKRKEPRRRDQGS